MTFFHYLSVIFCSPLYYLMIGRKKMALAVHLPIYIMALFTFLLFGFGAILWLGLTFHAAWDLRSRLLNEMVDLQAKAIAREMKNVSNS
ncbi:MAG: hypothetical protein AAB461_01110 [Patescibacteria group bacterium]